MKPQKFTPSMDDLKAELRVKIVRLMNPITSMAKHLAEEPDCLVYALELESYVQLAVGQSKALAELNKHE